MGQGVLSVVRCVLGRLLNVSLKRMFLNLRVYPVEAVVERRYRQGVIAGCLCPFGA